jgi:hypothetical protein
MLLNDAVSDDSKLRRGHFFIPRLDRLDTSDMTGGSRLSTTGLTRNLRVLCARKPRST